LDNLGRLERVEIRDIWLGEATHFTPWLAKEQNLALLADTLGLDLELEAQEKAVGPFRADILCKDANSEEWVLVENQLERTDHSHLGQLLTYASGLKAVTIVWIATRFTEEHRSTLDWLNQITDASFRFFGLELEAWKIGNSAAAPKFNIVSKPNNWSRSVASAARAIDESELSDVRLRQLEYWKAFHDVLNELAGPISGNRKAQPQSWMSYGIGRSHTHVGAVMIRPQRKIRSEVYLSGDYAKQWFRQLEEQKADIENDLGYKLVWEFLPDRNDCRISSYLEEIDPEDETHWREQHVWLARRVNDFHRVFSDRVRELTSEIEEPNLS